MQLAALVEREDHVCARYRLAAFAPHFARAGHGLSLHALPRSLFARLRLFRDLRSADAVILQRKLLPAAELFWLRRHARRLVFDFDDAVWGRDSYAAKGVRCPRRERAFRRTVAACDLAVAGNAFLAAKAGPRAVVVPTCVEPSAYPLAPHARPGVSLVWVGSSSTLQGLERTRPLWETLGREVPGVRLKLLCDRFARFDPLPIDCIPWSERTEAAEIAAAGVGIGWVPDDDWSRGKCGLKLLQYMAAGLPAVANPVGVQSGMIAPGETGFLATTAAEWVAAVRALADPAVRRRFGRAARQRVERDFAVAVGAARWLELLDRVAATGRAA